MCNLIKPVKKILWLLWDPKFLFIISIIAFGLLINYSTKDVNNLIASAAGAFFGAAAAFILNILYKNRRESLGNLSTLKKAEFTINKMSGFNRSIDAYIKKSISEGTDDVGWLRDPLIFNRLILNDLKYIVQ